MKIHIHMSTPIKRKNKTNHFSGQGPLTLNPIDPIDPGMKTCTHVCVCVMRSLKTPLRGGVTVTVSKKSTAMRNGIMATLSFPFLRQSVIRTAVRYRGSNRPTQLPLTSVSL